MRVMINNFISLSFSITPILKERFAEGVLRLLFITITIVITIHPDSSSSWPMVTVYVLNHKNMTAVINTY